MGQSRIEIFRAMSEQQPDDEMIWYGLASEYVKLESWEDAVAALENVIRLKPDYTAAYQLLGSSLMGLGRKDEAVGAWTRGLEAADRTGAWKAKQHMEGLLKDAGGVADNKFCES
jgi:predicted Zn-dependent protease